MALAALEGLPLSELRARAVGSLNRHLHHGVEVVLAQQPGGGVTIEVRGPDAPAWSPADVSFLEAVCGVLGRATESRRSMETLRRQAFHDALTGLPNRAALDEGLEAAVREGVSLTALVCDLDGLKQVNDRFGHRAGDEVIITSAARIRQACRDTDLVARTGGDEFVVACCGISRHEARALAARIDRAVAAPLYFEHWRLDVGVSIGIAMSGEHPPSAPMNAADLLDAADLAMYRSKERHRSDLRGRSSEALRSGPDSLARP